MVYKYDRAIDDWREREMIHYVYMGAEIQQNFYSPIKQWANELIS